MFPKLKAVKSWTRTIITLDKTAQMDKQVAEMQESEKSESYSWIDMGREIRNCDDCAPLNQCDFHREKFGLDL